MHVDLLVQSLHQVLLNPMDKLELRMAALDVLKLLATQPVRNSAPDFFQGAPQSLNEQPPLNVPPSLIDSSSEDPNDIARLFGVSVPLLGGPPIDLRAPLPEKQAT